MIKRCIKLGLTKALWY